MATMERQEELGNLLRLVDDVTYQLRLSLFKFMTQAAYLMKFLSRHLLK
jgi:hypothetical protein